MKNESIVISYKNIVGASKSFSQEYSVPETLEEAIQVDGADELFKLYLAYRLIKFRDKNRIAKEKSEKEKFAKALENKDDPKVAAALAALGM